MPVIREDRLFHTIKVPIVPACLREALFRRPLTEYATSFLDTTVPPKLPPRMILTMSIAIGKLIHGAAPPFNEEGSESEVQTQRLVTVALIPRKGFIPPRRTAKSS